MNDLMQTARSERYSQQFSTLPAAELVVSPQPRSEPSTSWRADICLLSTALMWGTNILVFKSFIADFNPWVFNALRLVFATITLGILVLGEAWLKPSVKSHLPVRWWRVLLFSLLNGFVYLIVFVQGISLTTAGNTALILASMPMWTAILATFFLSERLPRITWLGLFVTFVGTIIVTTQGSGPVSLSSRYFWGNLFMMIAALAWATGTVVSRPILQSMTPLRLAFISALITTPMHFALAGGELWTALPQALEPSMLLAIVYSGVFSTGVAYATWHTGVRALGASHAAVYQNVVTLVAVVGGWVILKEQPLPAQIFGGMLTLAGLYLMRRGRG